MSGPAGQESGGSPAVRWVVELRRVADDRVEGVLTREGSERGEPFSGWLDLIWRLEASVALVQPDAPASD